jgi:hypothetical protein
MEDNTQKRIEEVDQPILKDKEIPFDELIAEIRY